MDNIKNMNGELNISSSNLPFDVKRVFYTYDIPGGESRGAHAHISCHQFLVAVCGCFDVVIDDGTNIKRFTLDRPFYGLHIPPGVWAHQEGYSSGSICLVLTSELFDESDYIRDYNEYLKMTKDSVECCKIINLDKHHSDRKGNLTVVENYPSCIL